MEFYQTVAGRTFYEKTLPELINSMDNLTEALRDHKEESTNDKASDLDDFIEITIVADVEGINSPNIEQSLDNELSSLFASLGGEVIDIKPYKNHKN